jgi:hypothetical protein
MAEEMVYVGWSAAIREPEPNEESHWIEVPLGNDANSDMKALFYGLVRRVDRASFERYERARVEFTEARRVMDDAPKIEHAELMDILRPALISPQ